MRNRIFAFLVAEVFLSVIIQVFTMFLNDPYMNGELNAIYTLLIASLTLIFAYVSFSVTRGFCYVFSLVLFVLTISLSFILRFYDLNICKHDYSYLFSRAADAIESSNDLAGLSSVWENLAAHPGVPIITYAVSKATGLPTLLIHSVIGPIIIPLVIVITVLLIFRSLGYCKFLPLAVGVYLSGATLIREWYLWDSHIGYLIYLIAIFTVFRIILKGIKKRENSVLLFLLILGNVATYSLSPIILAIVFAYFALVNFIGHLAHRSQYIHLRTSYSEMLNLTLISSVIVFAWIFYVAMVTLSNLVDAARIMLSYAKLEPYIISAFYPFREPLQLILARFSQINTVLLLALGFIGFLTLVKRRELDLALIWLLSAGVSYFSAYFVHILSDYRGRFLFFTHILQVPAITHGVTTIDSYLTRIRRVRAIFVAGILFLLLFSNVAGGVRSMINEGIPRYADDPRYLSYDAFYTASFVREYFVEEQIIIGTRKLLFIWTYVGIEYFVENPVYTLKNHPNVLAIVSKLNMIAPEREFILAPVDWSMLMENNLVFTTGNIYIFSN